VTESPLAILSGRLCPWLRPAFDRIAEAQRSGRLGHAWLITGPAGIGKLNLALAAAHRLLGATAPPAELGPTEALAALGGRHLPADHHPDLHWIYPEEDKHSVSVEQIRAVIETISLTAHRGKAKIVIIEPADAMTASAANALLKTLEEPSGDTYLWLLSQQPGRLPATIRSRCQRLEIVRPSAVALADWLGHADQAEIAELAALAGGAPLRIAALIREGAYIKTNELEHSLSAIYEDRLDPLAVADAWAKGDAELALSWLKTRLNKAIRERYAPEGSTTITVRDDDALHNPWPKMTLKTLFDQYDQAERLLNLLGSGVNLELALQSLLVGFQANQGQP
jgi:DNA polymerase III subunit delta'